jgi:hypothetical protein
MKSRQEHVELLAEELSCKLVISPEYRTSAMMYVESGYVEVPPAESQIDYLINLHELGHVFYGHTQGRPPHKDKTFYFDNGVLRSEAQAWEWALDNCSEAIDDTSRIFMWDNCLGTYYLYGYIASQGQPERLLNGNRHYVKFIYDEPDEYFTKIVKRIQGKLSNFKIPYKA